MGVSFFNLYSAVCGCSSSSPPTSHNSILPFFFALTVSSRDKGRNYRGSALFLATALCSALTLGDMTGFFIELANAEHAHTLMLLDFFKLSLLDGENNHSERA